MNGGAKTLVVAVALVLAIAASGVRAGAQSTAPNEANCHRQSSTVNPGTR